MKIKLSCLRLVIALSAVLLSGLACACMRDLPARGQIFITLNFEPRHARGADIPDVRTLQVGDLVTLDVPSKAVVTSIEPGAGSEPAIVMLDEGRYLALSDEGGGKAFPDVRGLGLGSVLRSGPGTGLRRYAVARAGLGYLRVSYAGRVQLIQLNIAPAKIIELGKTVRGNETTTALPLGLGYYDVLELELPGRPGDGWSVTPEEDTGYRLAAIEAVEASPAAKAGSAVLQRVRLRFSKAPSRTSNDFEVKLEVKSSASRFNFTIHHHPTPAC